MPARDALIDRPAHEVAAVLREAIVQGDELQLTGLLRELSTSTAGAIVSGVPAIVRQRARLHRLASLIEDLRGVQLADEARGSFSEADRILGSCRTREVVRLSQAQWERRYTRIRDRVFTLLHVPHTLSEIVAELGCDPSEAFRATSELAGRYLIVEVDISGDHSDDGPTTAFVRARSDGRAEG